MSSYVRTKEDGYTVQGMGATLENLSKLGVFAPTGLARESSAVLSAESVADLERSLDRVFTEPVENIDVQVCRRILIAALSGSASYEVVDGEGRRVKRKPEEIIADVWELPLRAVKAVVRLGKGRLVVDLVSRGLVTMPKGKDAPAGMQLEIQARREELGV